MLINRSGTITVSQQLLRVVVLARNQYPLFRKGQRRRRVGEEDEENVCWDELWEMNDFVSVETLTTIEKSI